MTIITNVEAIKAASEALARAIDTTDINDELDELNVDITAGAGDSGASFDTVDFRQADEGILLVSGPTEYGEITLRLTVQIEVD